MIELAEYKDLEEIVNMHYEIFKEASSSKFGKGFLMDFYKTIISSDKGICYVWKEDSKIIGFVCGILSYKLFNFSFKIKFVYRILCCSPKGIINIFRLIKKAISTRNIQAEAELLFIAVNKGSRRQGIATKLLDSFYKFLIAKEVKKFKVFSETNSMGHLLYDKRGFTLVKTIELFGRKMYCYVKEI